MSKNTKATFFSI